MRQSFLPFSPPAIGEDEIAAVVEALRSDWITTGPKTRLFEQEFAKAVDAPASLALNSCTAALHTALVVGGVGPGDEVITTPMTFAASVNVIEHVGARPVLVDIEPDTLNIDPERVRAAVTPRTKAILPVHYAGHPAQMRPIRELAAERGLLVVEDAAHSFPASYGGRAIGADGTIACFSFYATKNLTTGEGGMLTGPPEFIEKARVVALHGMSRDAWRRYDKGGSWFYEIHFPGFKYNMTDIAASIGLVQLRRQDELAGRRREVVEAYTRAFSGHPALELPHARPEIRHAWHLYVLRLREGSRLGRDALIERLRARNIATSVHFIPVHLHPYYRSKYGYKPTDFPVAFSNYERMVSLPLHPRLSEMDVADVTQAVLTELG